MKTKVKQVTSIPMEDFLKNHSAELHLNLTGEEVGLQRLISEPAPNRPGLALAGFFTYFATKRIQVLGNSEMSYLRKMEPETRHQRFDELCKRDIPAIVVARSAVLPEDLVAIANKNSVPVFSTKLVTMKFLNTTTLLLENDFSPTTTLHGCMVDFRGIGVLITGKSGSGKSETTIGLLERGGALVADDIVCCRWLNGELTASAPDLSRGYIEIRGIGIVNVANLYGLTSIRPEKRLDLVVQLTAQKDLNAVDRVGIKQKTLDILGQEVAMVEIPVAPGRDTARMVTIAALHQQLRRLGYNMADEFNQRLLKHMNG